MATLKQPLTIVIIPTPSTTAKHATTPPHRTMSPVNPNRKSKVNPNPQPDDYGHRIPKPNSAGKHTTKGQPQEGHSNNDWPPITLHVPPAHYVYPESRQPPFNLTTLQAKLFDRGQPFPNMECYIGKNQYYLTAVDKFVLQCLLGRIFTTPSNPLGYVFLSELMDLLQRIVHPCYMTEVKSSTISAVMKQCFGLTVKQINYCKICKHSCLKSNCGDHYHKSIELGRGRATAVFGIAISV